jgi:glycosyltransferase involved in cell wall biosynthesis
LSEDKKIKVLTISDHPLLPSGVGTQTRYVIESLLNSGKFQVVSLGGAIKHPDYSPTKTNEYGDDWIIFPVDGYGDKNIVRQKIMQHRPDILYFMTDPRFYEWLWEFEDEIRKAVPMVYYHVWDNGPLPKFNKPFYVSNDYIATISKVTSEIVKGVAPEVTELYIPHAVNSVVFRKHSVPQEMALLRQIRKENNLEGKFVCFWNNRNARRKMSGSLVWWWKTFCDKVGHDKATLILHTDPADPHGQPLEFLAHELGLLNGQIHFSKDKVQPQQLAIFYNLVDCTINISDAEGFGLSTLESLSCGTPVIVTMTGGLQEQVTDGENWFGVGIEPTSKAVIGSQQVPYIYEDRINEGVFVDALLKMYNATEEERQEMGRLGAEHVRKNYSFETFNEQWVDFMLKVHEESGSWDTRKNYEPWECIEL